MRLRTVQGTRPRALSWQMEPQAQNPSGQDPRSPTQLPATWHSASVTSRSPGPRHQPGHFSSDEITFYLRIVPRSYFQQERPSRCYQLPQAQASSRDLRASAESLPRKQTSPSSTEPRTSAKGSTHSTHTPTRPPVTSRSNHSAPISAESGVAGLEKGRPQRGRSQHTYLWPL